MKHYELIQLNPKRTIETPLYGVFISYRGSMGTERYHFPTLEAAQSRFGVDGWEYIPPRTEPTRCIGYWAKTVDGIDYAIKEITIPDFQPFSAYADKNIPGMITLKEALEMGFKQPHIDNILWTLKSFMTPDTGIVRSKTPFHSEDHPSVIGVFKPGYNYRVSWEWQYEGDVTYPLVNFEVNDKMNAAYTTT